VAVIGHGHWGKNHVRNFHDLGALTVVCDRDPERRLAVENAYPGTETCADVEDVLSMDNVQGVVLATPAETHEALALRCLEAGRDVLVEKPLALTVAGGERLVAKARESGRILMVGHILEYHPGIQALQDLVASGGVGTLQYVYSNRLNLGKVRREENILWSFAPHDVAFMLRLLGEMPVEVAASGGNYVHPEIADVTVTTLGFPGGVRGHIHVSWLHPFKEQKLVVVGDKGMAVFDDQTKSLELYEHGIEWVGEVPVARKAEPQQLPYPDAEPLREECQAFLNAISTRQPPITDGESGLRVLRVLSACQTSMEKGGVVEQMGTTENGYYRHATAIIDPGATIGEGTKIWHFCHVMGSATIGRDCILGQNSFVGEQCTIGNRVKIQNNVSIYQGVDLEDDVFCGPSMVFTNVRNPRAHVERKEAFERTHVGRGATLGANCTVVCGNKIGRFATVAAGAVVTSDVPDYALVMGVPARPAGWMCACGERLASAAESTPAVLSCSECGQAYVLGDKGLCPESATA